jgi:hypothetical protein
VFGMFIVNSAPASVLFYSGTSHSFISAQFVTKHGIPVHSMSSHMLVSSPWCRFQDCGQGISCKFHSIGFQGNRHHTWDGMAEQG